MFCLFITTKAYHQFSNAQISLILKSKVYTQTIKNFEDFALKNHTNNE